METKASQTEKTRLIHRFLSLPEWRCVVESTLNIFLPPPSSFPCLSAYTLFPSNPRSLFTPLRFLRLCHHYKHSRVVPSLTFSSSPPYFSLYFSPPPLPPSPFSLTDITTLRPFAYTPPPPPTIVISFPLHHNFQQ